MEFALGIRCPIKVPPFNGPFRVTGPGFLFPRQGIPYDPFLYPSPGKRNPGMPGPFQGLFRLPRGIPELQEFFPGTRIEPLQTRGITSFAKGVGILTGVQEPITFRELGPSRSFSFFNNRESPWDYIRIPRRIV